MSSDEDDLGATSGEMCPSMDDHLSLDVEGNACDSCSQRSIQDTSVKDSGQADDMKSNCDNNSLQQEMYCENVTDKENSFNAAFQTNDKEDNLVAKKDKITSEGINLGLSSTNESKSCMNIPRQGKREPSCNTSTYSL